MMFRKFKLNRSIPKPTGSRELLDCPGWEFEVDLAVKTIYSNRWQTKEFARLAFGKLNKGQVTKAVYDFCKENLSYKRDHGFEKQMLTPSRLWWNRKEPANVTSLAIFMATVLLNLDIKVELVLVSFREYKVEQYEHLYIRADGKYILDLAHGVFNESPEFVKIKYVPL